MTEQISRIITIRIWAYKGGRLPSDEEVEQILDDGTERAAEMIAQGCSSGEIRDGEERVHGWWETTTKDDREEG